MNQDKIKKACLEVVNTAEAAYVTSIGGDGYPYTRAMFNLRNAEQFPKQAAWFNKDDFLTLFSTNTSSLKVKQLEVNPKVSVYYCHPQKIQGVMLSGDMELLTDPEHRQAVWGEGSERYYHSGPDDPDHTVLRLQPKSVQGWFPGMRFSFEL